MVADAQSRRVGYGMDEGVAMGPVISAESKARIESLVDAGVQQDAGVLVDGRGKEVDGFRDGYFLHPTVVGNVAPGSEFAHTEIFGPVLSSSGRVTPSCWPELKGMPTPFCQEVTTSPVKA